MTHTPSQADTVNPEQISSQKLIAEQLPLLRFGRLRAISSAHFIKN
jgi:hypothetical protein